RLTFARVLFGNITGVRSVARNDRTLALESRSNEHLVELTRLVDAGTDEHGITASVHKTGLSLHVEQDVVDDLFGAWLTGDDLLHSAPALPELGPREVGHTLGFYFKPFVYLIW